MFADLKFEAKEKVTNPTRTSGSIMREQLEIGTGLVHWHRNPGDPDDKYANKSKVNHSVRCKKKTPEEIKQALDADDDPFVDEGEEDTYEKVAETADRRTPSVCTWNQLQPITMQIVLRLRPAPSNAGSLCRGVPRDQHIRPFSDIQDSIR
jgi:hypothetical protein